MFHMNDDDVHDSEARPSDWTGAGEDAAHAAQPVDTENEPVVFQVEQIGSESDVDIDLPPWICSFNDGSVRFSSWGTNVATGVVARKVTFVVVHVAITMFTATMNPRTILTLLAMTCLLAEQSLSVGDVR
eukprot:3115016-Amphidinium_carterae.3